RTKHAAPTRRPPKTSAPNVSVRTRGTPSGANGPFATLLARAPHRTVTSRGPPSAASANAVGANAVGANAVGGKAAGRQKQRAAKQAKAEDRKAVAPRGYRRHNPRLWPGCRSLRSRG